MVRSVVRVPRPARRRLQSRARHGPLILEIVSFRNGPAAMSLHCEHRFVIIRYICSCGINSDQNISFSINLYTFIHVRKVYIYEYKYELEKINNTYVLFYFTIICYVINLRSISQLLFWLYNFFIISIYILLY